MNTEQKCQYCPKCVPIRCRCMNRCEHPWKCIDANCTCHQSRHTEWTRPCVCGNRGYDALINNTHFPDCPANTEQKGWRGVSTLAEDLHGRIALSWGNAEEVRSEIERFIERTLQEEREELVNKLEALSQHRFTDKKKHDVIHWMHVRELINALIKDKI